MRTLGCPIFHPPLSEGHTAVERGLNHRAGVDRHTPQLDTQPAIDPADGGVLGPRRIAAPTTLRVILEWQADAARIEQDRVLVAAQHLNMSMPTGQHGRTMPTEHPFKV